MHPTLNMATSYGRGNVMTRIALEERHLTLELDGIDRVLALRRRLRVPLDHVVSVDTGTSPPAVLASRIPGAVAPRTLYQQSGRGLLERPREDHSLVIGLYDERYEKLVVTVDDPTAVAEAIRTAVRAA